MKKTFPLSAVLSVTTGRLCCDIGGVYEILNHITGDSLFTHVLPRANRFARPFLLRDHPELAAAGTDEALAALDVSLKTATTPMNGVRSWLASLGLKPEYSIASYASEWTAKNPLAELEEMVGADRVVPVVVES